MDLSNFWWQSAAGGGGACGAPTYLINNSLRFRGAQRLSRTVATAGNRKVATLSYWVKITNTSSYATITSWYSGSNNNQEFNTGGGNPFSCGGHDRGFETLGRAARDPSAWYHVVIALDSTQANADDRIKFYLNGVLATELSVNAPLGQNEDYGWNNAGTVEFGRRIVYDNDYFTGYIAEYHNIDGTALGPTSFGEFNAAGVWVPKKFAGPWGTNGFYLAFDDVTQIGKDSSGNNNHFTPTGFQLTDSTKTDYDWMKDSPTDNYATLNPLDVSPTSTPYFVGANLGQSVPNPGGGAYARSTFVVPPGTGKIYFEVTNNVAITTAYQGLSIGLTSLDDQGPFPKSGYYQNSRRLINRWTGPTTQVPDPPGNSLGAGSVVQIAADLSIGSLWVGIDNVWYIDATTTGGNPSAGTGASDTTIPTNVPVKVMAGVAGDTTYNVSAGISFNAGQRPFKYTPPAGFQPLSTAALPDVTPCNPSKHFTTILDTGANILTAAQAKFPNGLWWIKDRANNNQHQLVDSVRGGNLALPSPSSGAEAAYVAPAGNSVAWCWNAPDTFTGAGGTIPSTGRRNVSAGFSIVSYSGTGTPGTVAHGLSKAPEFLIVRGRSFGSNNYKVYNAVLGNKFLNLNENLAAANAITSWNNTAPTATVFSVGTDQDTNQSDTYVAYCWHSVPGYSAFGSYVGNGNADGPFIYTGFRPAFVMVKSINASGPTIGNWLLNDSLRDPYNGITANSVLAANLADKEPGPGAGTFEGNYFDLLSNGFKLRSAANNANGHYTCIYCAFAEHPFGGKNVSPVTAR